jgi:hypothetical protein
MKAAWYILSKVLVTQFYKQNAGLFLMAFIFLFGIVDAGHLLSYHQSLMLSIISLPLFFAIVLFVWMLYNIKCIAFCINSIQSNEGSFMYQLRALPGMQQWLLYTATSVLLYMPVLSYAIVLAVFAIKIKSSVSWQVMGWQLLMIQASAGMLYVILNSTKELFLTRLIAAAQKKFAVKTGYYAFLPLYIFKEKKAAFAIVKIFSLLVLGMLLVRNEDSFDADLFGIFYPILIASHASLVLYCVDFNETFLHTSRNLPIHWIKVAGMYVITWCLILLPEAFFLLMNNHGNLSQVDLVMHLFLAAAMLFIFTGIALGCGLNTESYLLFVFMVYIVVFFLEKASGTAITATVIAVLACMVFKSHYYSFERDQEK